MEVPVKLAMIVLPGHPSIGRLVLLMSIRPIYRMFVLLGKMDVPARAMPAEIKTNIAHKTCVIFELIDLNSFVFIWVCSGFFGFLFKKNNQFFIVRIQSFCAKPGQIAQSTPIFQLWANRCRFFSAVKRQTQGVS